MDSVRERVGRERPGGGWAFHGGEHGQGGRPGGGLAPRGWVSAQGVDGRPGSGLTPRGWVGDLPVWDTPPPSSGFSQGAGGPSPSDPYTREPGLSGLDTDAVLTRPAVDT